MTEYTSDKMCFLSFLVLTVVLFRRVGAVPSLNNCGGSSDDKFAEVIRGSTSNTFTCSLGPRDTGLLEWNVHWFPTNKEREDGAGQCPSPSSNTDTCTSKALQPAFIPTRTSVSHSVMTINSTELKNTRLVSTGSLVCKVNSMEDRCTMDYITPASGMCSTQVVTSSSPWKPSTSCSITKGESSRGRYQCQGSYRKQGTSQDSWTSTWVDMSVNSLPQGQASCSPPSPSLPPNDGRYSFRVRLRPGRQFVDAGTVELRRPTTPIISCDPTLVPENNNVSCTCTANVGQPTGSLRWLSGSKNNFNTNSPLLTGDSPLVLTRQLTRADHNVTQFRCDVLWSNKVNSSDSYTAAVGFPPSSVELKINSSQANQDMVVQEHNDVTFTCSATGGNPAADVTLSGPRLQSTPVTSQVPHVVPDVQCGNSGSYRCTARNKFGPEQVASAALYVHCKPRRDDESIGEINFINKSAQVPFDVIAFPLANQVSFSFLGSNGSSPPSAVDSSIISLGGQCVQKGQSLFTSTCTVRVNNVTTDTAAGVYQVTVNNTVGVANFRLTVKYGAPPSSSPQDNTVAIIVGVIAVVVIAGVVAAVVIIIRRRNGNKSNGLVRTGSNGKREEINDMSHLDRSSSSTLPPPPEGPLSDQPYVPGATDVYAVVNKTNKETQAQAQAQATNAGNPSDEYAVVVKTPKGKKATSKSKPKNVTSKSKPKKGKSDAPIYGNVPTKANAKAKKASQTSQKEEDTGRNVNQDGLIYVDVDLPTAKSSSEAPPKPVDSDQGVEYSTVDFQRTK